MPSIARFQTKIALVLAVIFLFSLPALWTGFMGDDYMHYAVLNAKNLPIEKPDDLSLFGLFSFINGEPERNRKAMDLGVIPWWTYSGMKYAFWRPVSEVSHWIDHKIWPRSPALMHLHSIAWYLSLCAMLAVLYRRTMEATPVAILALIIYGLDSTHGFTLSWIANRNGLITAFFGLTTLYTYTRWREDSNVAWECLSLLLMLVTLLSAELGISIFGYLGAYALVLDSKGRIKGCLATIPHFIVIAAWWLFYKQAGFGAANADAYYIDPAANPVGFLVSLAERLPVLLASQWGIIPAEVYGFVLQHNASFVFFCIAFLFAILIPVILTCTKNKGALFWLLGMLFSLLPATTALPHDRVLIFAGMGASPALAFFLFQVFREKQILRFIPRYYLATVAGLMVLFHLILSPLLMPLMAYSTKIWSDQITQAPSHFPEITNIESKRLVLVGAPLAAALAIAPFRFYRDEPIPERIWVISTLDQDFQYHKLSSNSFEINLATGFIQGAEAAVRDFKQYPFRINDRVTLSGLDIKVSQLTQEGTPTQLTLTFDKPLDSDSLIFLRWNNKAESYERFVVQ